MALENVGGFAIGELAIIFVMAALLWRLKTDSPESKLVHFAAVILTALALIFMLSMAMYYWDTPKGDKPGKEIFDRCAQIIPPIVTLVVGYFFGRQESDRTRQLHNDPTEQSHR